MKRGVLRTLLVCLLALCLLGNAALGAFAAPVGNTKKGDANNDGMVLANDAMLVLQYSVKAIPADRVNLAMCDMDGNGMILANDAMIILQYSVGMGPAEPEEPSVPEPEEKQYLPNRSEDFTFLVGCQQGEDYLRENLVLQGENGAVDYSVAEEEEGIYRIAATKPYQQYQTYYAWVAEDMALPEYEDFLGLEFNIVGPDYANVEFNEDNLIFLKPLELQEYGTSGQYDLQWDEEAQRYYLTLFRLENIQDSMIGKVIGIGDYSNTDEILEDGSRELCFGKLDKIGRNPEGQPVLELTIPELSEVYDKLDIYFTGGTGDIQIEGDPEAAFTDAVVNSEGFAEYLAATHLAAESYAAEHGLVTETMTASVKDNLKFELTKHSLDPIEGRNACKLELGGKISYKVPLKTKDGQLSGSIVMSCYADITSEISAGGHFKDDESTELSLKNTTTTTLGFETKFDLEYNQKSETTYLVHNTTHKIHTATCRIATKETNSANQQKLTAQELSELYDGDKEAMQRDECKVCKAVTGLDGTAYAYNRNTGVLHCMNCIHVGSIKECNLYTLYPANTFGFDTCEDCRPQDRQSKDFDKRMENAIQGSDWGETVTELREMLGDSLGAQKPGPDSDPALSADFNVLGVFNIRLGVEPVFEFDMKASVKFEITATTTNEYGIRSEGKSFKTFHDEKTEKPKIDLEFTGEADAKFGIELSAKAYPTGFGEGIYIEIKGQVGLYGHLTGILSVEGQLGGDIDAYCAARLEAGLYLRLDGSWKILWFDDDFVILEETRKALLKWGYDRMYYAFEEEEVELTVSDPDEYKLLKLSDMMEAKYLDLTNMQYGSDTISPMDSSQARVAVEITNEDGTPCDYVVYSDGSGILYKKYGAPEEFTAVVTVQVTPKVRIDSLGDFQASRTTNVKKPVYGYSMDPLTIKISVKEAQESQLLTRVHVYSGDTLIHAYALQYNEEHQLSGATFLAAEKRAAGMTFSYDKDGRLLKADCDNARPDLGDTVYTYNSADQLACLKWYYRGTDVPYHQYDYEYDGKGDLISQTHLISYYGEPQQRHAVYSYTFVYDENRRIVEEQEHIDWIKDDFMWTTEYGTYSRSEYVTVRQYSYDTMGRILSVRAAEIPEALCDPQGNPDLKRYIQMDNIYDFAPLRLQKYEENISINILDDAGITVWEQCLGSGSLIVDSKGYVRGATEECSCCGHRCELFYGEEADDLEPSMTAIQMIMDNYVPFCQSLPEEYTASDGSVAKERSCVVVEFETGKPNLVVHYRDFKVYSSPVEFYEVWIIYGIENGKVVELYRDENYAPTRRDMYLAYSTDGGYALREEYTISGAGYYELIIRYPENVTDITLFGEYKYIPMPTEDYGVLQFWNSAGECIEISMQ